MRNLLTQIELFFARSFSLKFYLLSSLILCFILSLTNHTWNHPDEWYQTVEFANYLSFNKLTYSPEVIHHLRNLFWPLMLAIPMKLADLIAPHSYGLMMFAIQFFSGLLNLLVLVSLKNILDQETSHLNLTSKSKTIILFAATFAFFLVSDSIRPSQEHLSIVAFWFAVYCVHKKWWLRAGFSTISIFAFKYPAAFLSLGLCLVLFFRFITKEISFKDFAFYVLGLLGGLLLFGSVDWYIYGRPWESFWMYSLYNLFAGLSHKNFGEQSALVYLQYFRGQWSTLFFLWVFLLPSFIVGVLKNIKNHLIILFPLMLYLVAHLLIKHKEPRFMAVFDYVFILYAGIGLFTFNISPKVKKFFWAVFLLVNSFLLMRELKGDLFGFHHTFLKISEASRSDYCATITLKKPYAFYLNHMDEIPLMGYWPMHRKESLETGFAKTLNWLGKIPRCQAEQKIFVQVPYWEIFWQNQQCEIQSSYFLGTDLTRKLSLKKMIDGVWLNCPISILSNFKKIEMKNILVYKLQKLDPFPSINTSGEDLIVFQKTLEQQNNWWIGSFPEW